MKHSALAKRATKNKFSAIFGSFSADRFGAKSSHKKLGIIKIIPQNKILRVVRKISYLRFITLATSTAYAPQPAAEMIAKISPSKFILIAVSLWCFCGIVLTQTLDEPLVLFRVFVLDPAGCLAKKPTKLSKDTSALSLVVLDCFCESCDSLCNDELFVLDLHLVSHHIRQISRISNLNSTKNRNLK